MPIPPLRLITRPGVVVALALAIVTAGCSSSPAPAASRPTTNSSPAPMTASPPSDAASAPPPDASAETWPAGVTEPPAWLGTRPLADSTDVEVPAQTTPPELVDRRFVTRDLLPPPPDASFTASVTPVPADVAARSTWSDGCPVGLDDLRYVTVAFWGFDERPHTGELLVNADAADDVVSVFARLHALRFPIEQMAITSAAELDALPTGDGNVSGSFVCRPTRGSTRWSEHAYGLAVDVNPFQNPYVKSGRVLPELATTYTDRGRGLPGMITRGSPVVTAFAQIGWEWGGNYRSLTDPMHFSRDGR